MNLIANLLLYLPYKLTNFCEILKASFISVLPDIKSWYWVRHYLWCDIRMQLHTKKNRLCLQYNLIRPISTAPRLENFSLPNRRLCWEIKIKISKFVSFFISYIVLFWGPPFMYGYYHFWIKCNEMSTQTYFSTFAYLCTYFLFHFIALLLFLFHS